jgi:O-antigen/teichoic acid export membrane protein
MKTSAKNILANFISKIWGFVSLYLFSRLYLSFAGAEQFGVISYYALIFGIVSFVDVGISASLTREFAKEADDDWLLKLIRFFEKIFILICALGGVSICLFSKTISTHWLISATIPTTLLTHYVCLIGIGVATQLMSSIYFGALMGKQMQVWANSAQVILNIVKTVGGAFILYIHADDLYLFFLWQILCNVLYLFVLRSHVFGALKKHKTIVDIGFADVPKELWHYMGSMVLMAVLSAVGIQSDKLIASKFLSSADFGFYSLGSLLSQLPVLIVMPVAAAIFPVLVKNYSTDNNERLYKVYEMVSFGVVLLVLPLCFVLAIYGEEIFKLWLSQKNISDAPAQIRYLILFLTLGNTLQALQYLPFNLLMAKGKTKFTIYQAAFEIVFLIPALIYCIHHYGIAGIGIPWFIVKFLGYFYLLIVTDNLKPKAIHINYKKFIVLPFIFTAIIAIGTSFLFQQMPFNNAIRTIAAAMIIFICAIGINVFFYDKSFFKLQTLQSLLK